MKTLLMTTAAAVLVAGTAGAAEVKVMLEPDADGRISVERFGEFMAADAQFTAWDADGDGFVTKEEYAGAVDPEILIKVWDEDDDGELAVTEIDTAYSPWDSDGNGVLTAEELDVGWGSDPNFTTWDGDADGMLSQEEFQTGIWTVHDLDGDGFWSADEMSGWQNSAFRAGFEVDGAPAGEGSAKQ